MGRMQEKKKEETINTGGLEAKKERREDVSAVAFDRRE